MALVNLDKPEDKEKLLSSIQPSQKIQPKETSTSLTKDQILDIINSTLSDEGMMFDVPFTFVNKGTEVTLNLTLKILDALDNIKIQKEVYKQYGDIRIQDFFTTYQKYQEAATSQTLKDEQIFKFVDYFEMFRKYASDYVAKSVIKVNGQPKIKTVLDNKEIGYFESEEVFKFFLIKTGSGLFEVLYTAMLKNSEYTEAMEKSKKS